MAKKPESWEEHLKAFKRATQKSMELALVCSQMALKHFADHGDVSRIEQFYEAMPQNFHRRAAFLKWCAAFSPLKSEKGKMFKDTSESAKPFNLEEAFRQPFWDFAPDTETVYWSTDDLVKAIDQMVSRFKKDKNLPKSEEAATKLHEFEGVVSKWKTTLGSNLPENDNEAATRKAA